MRYERQVGLTKTRGGYAVTLAAGIKGVAISK